MSEISAPVDFARIMKCNSCAESYDRDNSRPKYNPNQNNYSGNQKGYCGSSCSSNGRYE